MSVAVNPPHPAQLEERYDLIDELRTFSRACGNGDPVVLVHGAGVSSTYWQPALRHLAESGFRACAPDLPGFGRSQDPPWRPSFRLLTDHLTHWIEQVVGAPVHLVGQSVGCELAVMTAVEAPWLVRSLVLAAPAGLPCLHSVTRQLLLALLDAPREPVCLYPAILPDYLRCGIPRFLHLLWEQRRTRVDLLLPRVRQPALVLRGCADQVVSAARTAAVADLLPHARLTAIPGAHGAHYTHAAEFTKAVREFLLQVDSPAPPADNRGDNTALAPLATGPIGAGSLPPPGG